MKTALQTFKDQGHLTVSLGTFRRTLKFEERKEAEAAFNVVKPQKVSQADYMMLIAAMALMSNQRYISKVTFLFSMCDFNSSGSINRAELGIGLRTLFRGISVFFGHANLPSKAQLESSADILFKELDSDGSDVIEIGEVVSYAYRSKDLCMLFSPFAVSDMRIFEELIRFDNCREVKEKAPITVDKEEKKLGLSHKIRLTPDESRGIHTNLAQRQRMERKRPWKDPSVLTNIHGLAILRVFRKLAGDKRLIDLGELQRVAKVKELGGMCHQVELEITHTLAEEIKNNSQDFRRIMSSLSITLGEDDFRERVMVLSVEDVSLRGFCCLVWPKIKVSEIEGLLKYCEMIHAHDTLNELLRKRQDALTHPSTDSSALVLEVEPEDIDAIFRAFDVNGDGELSAEELAREGTFSSQQINQMMQMWDRDKGGTLDTNEMKSILYGMDEMVRRRLKDLFAASGARGT